MGKLFNERTEILLQTPVDNKYANKWKRWVLLPMCAYKVMVPYPSGSELNLFQETILKLFVSGAKEDAWIASILDLNIGLVEYVVDELIERRLLSSRRTITKEGMNVINGTSEDYNLKTGYVFYNYVTKTYADTFVPDDKFNAVSVEYRRGSIISFYIDESEARPISQKATIVHTDNEESDDIIPNALDILKICRRHKRRIQQLVIKDLDEYSDDDKLPRNIEKVALLGEKKYVYVATYVYLPPDDVINRRSLMMCYPFDSGVSTSNLEAITKLLRNSNNSALRNALEGLQMDAFGLSEEEKKNVKETHAAVDKEIRSVLSENISNYPYVYQKILKVEDLYRFINNLLNENKGNNRDTIQQKIGEYIIANYELVSGVLTDVAKRNDYFKAELLANKPTVNAENLKRIALSCGFSDLDNNFSRIFNVKRGQVKDALESSAVKSLLAYNLICASELNEHPFYKLAKRVPQFITYVVKLIDLRNDADHGNDVVYDFDTLAAYSIKNMYITYLMLEGLTFKNSKRKFDFEDERLISTDKNRIRITNSARLEVEKYYTDKIFDYSIVQKKLVALQEEFILKGNYIPSRASEVYEAIFKMLCGHRLTDNVASEIRGYSDKEANKKYLGIMKDKGFIIEEIPYYSLSKLSNTFRNYRNGTLSTLFYAWFFSENKKEDSMLPEVAESVPNLVKIIDTIIKLRKHNNKVEFDDPQLDFLKENFVDSINCMLEIMSKRNID